MQHSIQQLVICCNICFDNIFTGKYIEWVIEQRQLQEKERIRNTVISKKQLDTKELERRRKPLQKLDEENERKKRKQKQRYVYSYFLLLRQLSNFSNFSYV